METTISALAGAVVRIRAVLAAVMFVSAACPAWAGVSVERLRCEYLHDPLGIDVIKPRLSWVVLSEERGQRQTAYQVLVASTPDTLANDQGDLWDSGKVASDETIQVEYAGKPLGSRVRCYWKVRAWDKDGRPLAWSEPAFWTMGLLKASDWEAQNGLPPTCRRRQRRPTTDTTAG